MGSQKGVTEGRPNLAGDLNFIKKWGKKETTEFQHLPPSAS